MAHHPVTDADPKVMEDAMSTWHRLTEITKWTIVSVAVLLVLMVTFLV